MSRVRRHAAYPPRPLLHPGVRPCRRGDGQLQVGLDARLAVVAPDTPETRRLLDGLRSGVPPPPLEELSAAAARLCAELLERGLVLDGDELLPVLGSTDSRVARESLTALFTDPVAARTHSRRRHSVVSVSHERLPRAAARCQQLLTTAGVVVDRAGAHDPQLVLHLSRGEPERSLSDRWVGADQPHLLVCCTEATVRLGPLVVPGQTACLRCLDAHHTDRDPRHPLVVEQYAAAAGEQDALPEPIHHDLLDLAVVWAARDAVGWLDGLRPRTWSATISVDPALDLRPTRWSPHLGCGCGWAAPLARSG